MLVTMGLFGLVVVSLGVGFLMGYFAGGDRATAPADLHTHAPGPASPPAGAGAGTPALPVAADGHTHGPEGSAACAFDLPAKDQGLLAGMICNCNEPHCNRTPLLACHCETAHAMKTLAKQLIVEGRATSKEIGAELEKRWGAGIVPAR
jgi:hypothetical protein